MGRVEVVIELVEHVLVLVVDAARRVPAIALEGHGWWNKALSRFVFSPWGRRRIPLSRCIGREIE